MPFSQAEIAEDALLELIETYCREAGVRNLQKQIDKVYRKVSARTAPVHVIDEGLLSRPFI
jgi:ATP-dependent Lon protease